MSTAALFATKTVHWHSQAVVHWTKLLRKRVDEVVALLGGPLVVTAAAVLEEVADLGLTRDQIHLRLRSQHQVTYMLPICSTPLYPVDCQASISVRC